MNLLSSYVHCYLPSYFQVRKVNDAVRQNLLNIYNLFGTCYVGSVYDTSKEGNKIVYRDFRWRGLDHSRTSQHREVSMTLYNKILHTHTHTHTCCHSVLGLLNQSSIAGDQEHAIYQE